MTDYDIQKLRNEASKAGDILQAAICDLALGAVTEGDDDEVFASGCRPSDYYPTLDARDARQLNALSPDEAREACAVALSGARAARD